MTDYFKYSQAKREAAMKQDKPLLYAHHAACVLPKIEALLERALNGLENVIDDEELYKIPIEIRAELQKIAKGET